MNGEQYVEAFNVAVDMLATATGIDGLNTAYENASAMLGMLNGLGVFNGVTTYSDVCRTLNHIANYNIVRVANLAYERPRKSQDDVRRCLKEVHLCYSSIKEHDDCDTERGLLSDLYERISNESY